MGPVSIGVEVQQNTDGDTPSNTSLEASAIIVLQNFNRDLNLTSFIENSDSCLKTVSVKEQLFYCSNFSRPFREIFYKYIKDSTFGCVLLHISMSSLILAAYCHSAMCYTQ